MSQSSSINTPAASLPEAGSLTPLCLGRDEDQGWRQLAWVNTLCGLTLLVAAAQLWPRAEVLDTRAGNTLASTPVELVLAPEVAPGTTKQEVSIPPEQISRTPSEITAPAVTTVVEPALDQPIAITSVRAAVSPGAVTAAAATTTTSAAATSTDAPSPFSLVAGDQRTPQPHYPELARRRGQTGTVRVEFAVAGNGLVSQAEITRSSGFPLLDAAALNTVRTQWQIPASAGRRHYVDIVFQLRRGNEP